MEEIKGHTEADDPVSDDSSLSQLRHSPFGTGKSPWGLFCGMLGSTPGLYLLDASSLAVLFMTTRVYSHGQMSPAKDHNHPHWEPTPWKKGQNWGAGGVLQVDASRGVVLEQQQLLGKFREPASTGSASLGAGLGVSVLRSSSE